MFYKLLGFIVWRGAKWALRRRYGAVMLPKSLLAGGIVAVLGAIALLLTRQRGDS